MLITLVAKAFGALPGPVVELAGLIGPMAVAVAGASTTFVRLFGRGGASLGSVVLVILGNSTNGGSASVSRADPLRSSGSSGGRRWRRSSARAVHGRC